MRCRSRWRTPVWRTWIVQQLNLSKWRRPEGWPPGAGSVTELRREPKPVLRIGIVGKYVALEDSYLSVREALLHAGLAAGWDIDISWVLRGFREAADGLEHLPLKWTASSCRAALATRHRGQDQGCPIYAREHQVPYFGLCLGMQVMCIELARNVSVRADANSTEFNPKTPDPVISLMPDQRGWRTWEARCGWGCRRASCSRDLSAQAYAPEGPIRERHRHRWEFNNRCRASAAAAGMCFSGFSPDARLVETPNWIAVCIRGCSALSSIRSAARDPTARTRCSGRFWQRWRWSMGRLGDR